MTRTEHHLARGRRAGLLLAFALVTIGLAGCASTGRQAGVGASAPASQGEWRGREGVQEAIALLNQGDSVAARRRLMSVLRRDPGDGIARQLISQIDGDPRQMLGAQSYSYTMRDGETLSTIAQRALGNPMMFYILARYNNIAVPNAVMPGQVIQVPGRRPTPPAPRPQTRPAPPRPSRPEVATPVPAPAPTRPATNPALAARLRGQGLAALNAGAADRAVGLLRQAQAADPGNTAIRNDLARAMRVQRTLRSRR